MRGMAQGSGSTQAKAEAEPRSSMLVLLRAQETGPRRGFRQLALSNFRHLAKRISRTNIWEALRDKVSGGLDATPEV